MLPTVPTMMPSIRKIAQYAARVKADGFHDRNIARLLQHHRRDYVVDTERGYDQDRAHNAVHDDPAHLKQAHQILGRLLPGLRLVANRGLDRLGDLGRFAGIVELQDKAVGGVGPVEQVLAASSGRT